MQKEHQNTEIFAIALQQHRYLGMIFIPYIIRLISQEGEIYTIVENIHESNPKKWDSIIPEGGYELLKNINEISEISKFIFWWLKSFINHLQENQRSITGQKLFVKSHKL